MTDKPCPPLSRSQLGQLRAWCRQPLGRMLAEIERQALGDVLSDVFGYHLVVLDPCCRPDSLESSRILHRVIQSCTTEGLDDPPGMLACAQALPLQSDSIDAFVLPHVLECAEDAHQVLREIDRCLIAEGHLIVLGLNPYGWWGLKRLVWGWRGNVPWSLRFVSVPRLKDWLSLLGFDTLRVRYLFPHPPWGYGSSAKTEVATRSHREPWSFLAASYLLVARKRVATLTPIKPRWRPRRALLAGGVAGSNQTRVRRHG